MFSKLSRFEETLVLCFFMADDVRDICLLTIYLKTTFGIYCMACFKVNFSPS
jgi:hypothetical protein